MGGETQELKSRPNTKKSGRYQLLDRVSLSGATEGWYWTAGETSINVSRVVISLTRSRGSASGYETSVETSLIFQGQLIR